VHLITANTQLPVIDGITTTNVETAQQMSKVLEVEFPHADALIMSAAIADAKVKNYRENKISKDMLETLELESNQDILAMLAKSKRTNQVIVGFAAETVSDLSKLELNAVSKLNSKSMDLIYVNDVSNGAVFGSDNTKGLIIDESENVTKVPEISKETLSEILLDKLASKLVLSNG
jgi:phosphopantothenoylcysteine decarboxylase/phosphopantothenate--cysteine ligase